MLALRRPTEARLEELARAQADADVTYEGVGSTLTGEAPPGYRSETYERVVGRGDAAFPRACAALRDWRPQRAAGMSVWADSDIVVGTTVALAAPLPVGFALAACRVVAVVEEEDRWGFAYGTLPVHPESGEELFLVERRGDDVVFRIAVFSRPHDLTARIAAPVARLLQARTTERYLAAMSVR